jgi:antitoxin HicB
MNEGVKDMLVGDSLRESPTIQGKVYRCQVYLLPEPEDGGFSIIAATLPGVASQGDTEEEALANIKDAFEAVLAVYNESGQEIPWLPNPRDPETGSFVRWVTVNG